MTKDEALRTAYSVLSFHAQVSDAPAEPIQKAIDAIEEALAQPVQEPVAWWHAKLGVFDVKHFDQLQPLYTHPLKRYWVGLTDEELLGCAVFKHFDYDPPYINKDGVKFVASHEVSLRATYEKIEQALKEKNK
jgi:hypothetical protein